MITKVELLQIYDQIDYLASHHISSEGCRLIREFCENEKIKLIKTVSEQPNAADTEPQRRSDCFSIPGDEEFYDNY